VQVYVLTPVSVHVGALVSVPSSQAWPVAGTTICAAVISDAPSASANVSLQVSHVQYSIFPSASQVEALASTCLSV